MGTKMVMEFDTDSEYFGWLTHHAEGYVLSVRLSGKPLLHRASCLHIDRHNNPGALTQRGSRKVCADSKQEIRSWVQSNIPAAGIVLDKCPTCSP